jgi:hypothetical protein
MRVSLYVGDQNVTTPTEVKDAAQAAYITGAAQKQTFMTGLIRAS